jgi:hypothetical protein
MSFVPNLPATLMKDQSFIEDLARFADGVLTEKQVRQKWHVFDETEWTALGQSDELVEKIELEKVRRVHNGTTKRELAQLHITKGPGILNDLMIDPKTNPKHKIDAVRALDQLADPGPQRALDDSDRITVTINLGADEKLVFDCGSGKPNPPNNNVIDAIPDNTSDEAPVRRGPGRPRGSKNKPKVVAAEELLPFDQENNDELV